MAFFSNWFGHRKREMQAVARSLDLEFKAKDEYGLINLLKDFSLFRRGYAKRITHIMRKADQWGQFELCIFDYRFTVGGGNSTRVIQQTVFFVQAKDLELPHFLLKPEHFFHKIGTYLGMQDIDFAEQPEFSDSFLLQGQNEERIRQTMSEELFRFFTINKKWSLEGINYYLIFYRGGKRLKAAQIKEFYEKGMKVYELLRKENPEKEDGQPA